MSLFSKLFGGGGGGGGGKGPETKAETYNGFTITPEPLKEGPHYRIRARIEKEIGGEVKTHILIRADTLQDHTAACEASVAKARLMIDQQGEGIFG